jgi:carboxypeptidase PM20D1
LRILTFACGLAATLLASSAIAAPPKVDPALHDKALEILTKGIGYRTVEGGDQFIPYANYLKSELVAGGYKEGEITIEPFGGSAFLIARYPGTDPKKKPIVISGHMDVVEAKPEDWSRDPFTAVVENGYVYGRGASDNKFDVSTMVALLAKLRRDGWKPGREIVLALSGDEETKMKTTAELARRLKGAELVLNIDGGGGSLKDGKPVAYGVQGAEKTYADFTITVTDPGGHSSRPTPTNPIYRLSRALDRLGAYQFPVMWNEITLAAAAARAPNTPGPLGEALKRFAANPKDEEAVKVLTADLNTNPGLRTTCVATMIQGGHAPNALPQRAQATVNCRIFPGTSSESVRQTIAEVIAEPTATVARVMDDGSVDSPASPLRPDLMMAVSKAVHARYPGIPVVPSQASGATDSMHFRAVGIPSYGVSGMFGEAGESFAHGLNEKAPLATLDGNLAHYESILKDLAK